MILIKKGQDNMITCTPADLLPPAYTDVTQFMLTLFNKVYNYTFTVNDESDWPDEYSALRLPAADIATVAEGDYMYSISISALPNVVLDLGKVRVYSPAAAPATYNNNTAQAAAYIT